MYLEHIKIKNYKSCLRTELSLNKEMTTLIGINGSGKTNILKAISTLQASISGFRMGYDPRFKPTIIDTQLEGSLRDKGKSIRFKFDCIQPTENRNGEELVVKNQIWDFSEYVPGLKATNIPIGHMHILQSNEESGNYFYHDLHISSGESANTVKLFIKNKKKLPVNKIVKFLMDIRYYSASQFADPAKCPTSIEIEDNRETKRSRIANHSSLVLNMYTNYKANTPTYEKFKYLIGPDSLKLVDNIDFKEFSIPSNKYEIISAGKYKLIEANRKIIIPEIQIEEKLLSPSQLSEGTFKTIALLFYLLTDSSGIAIIEEPEVSVHRGLLISILEIIKSESLDRQIIISTHSESVLDKINPDWVRLVTRVPKKGTQAKNLDKSMSASKYRLLKNYLSGRGNLGEYFKEVDFENV